MDRLKIADESVREREKASLRLLLIDFEVSKELMIVDSSKRASITIVRVDRPQRSELVVKRVVVISLKR